MGSVRRSAAMVITACILAACVRRPAGPAAWIGTDPAQASLTCHDTDQTGPAGGANDLLVNAYRQARTDDVILRLPGGNTRVLQPDPGDKIYRDDQYALADHGSYIALIMVQDARSLRCARKPGRAFIM